MHLVPRPFARPGSAASSSQGLQTTRYAMRVVVAAGIQRQNIGAMAKKNAAHSRLLKSLPSRANFGSSGGSLVPSSLDVRPQDLSLFAPPEMVQKGISRIYHVASPSFADYEESETTTSTRHSVLDGVGCSVVIRKCACPRKVELRVKFPHCRLDERLVRRSGGQNGLINRGNLDAGYVYGLRHCVDAWQSIERF